ncbi:MAG: hypothetical protein B7X47_05790 [Ferrovum sp. 34-44-207]|nr:MAG: hypothetical protein B7X47_05790 [Ferrovum sp. 34-44-207]
MSQAQVDATALFCRLLDLAKPEINGQSLLEGRDKVAATHLLRERVLVLGKPLDWVTCPECGIETAHVVREKSPSEFILHCPECADVVAPGHLRETYKVALQKFVSSLLNGLELSVNGMKQIELDLIWRLGTTEKQRGKPVTWYFARRLHRPEIAIRLREQITTERTTQSCVILTSSEVPLPAGSALTEFDFPERQSAPGPQILDEASPNTTLRYVRDKAKAFIDGTEYPLEPRQQKILVALIDDLDHELDKESLKTACGSQSQRFSPSKEFERNPEVYRAFIRYLRDDERYALIIPDDDRDWLH